MKRKRLEIFGDFIGEYSLAKVNRLLGRQIADDFGMEFEVSLTVADSYGNLPSGKDLKRYSEIKGLYRKERKRADIGIFSSFPKSFSGVYGLKSLTADLRLGLFAWEESVFPGRWVKEVNEHLHGVVAISEHVRTVFRNSGVKIPIETINLGLTIAENIKPKHVQVNSEKRFKFLHISSAHARKGVDVLLKAFYEEFSSKDDVALILKVFPNPNSNVGELLEQLNRPNAPEVVVIKDGNLTEAEIVSLYKQADAAVYPSRAEGFGLPVAEAMLFKLPTIVTGYSGQMDFCSPNNCYLLDFDIQESTESHLGIPGARWAEPNGDQLKRIMRDLYEGRNREETNTRTANAYKVARNLTWDKTARSAVDFIKELNKVKHLKSKKMAVITTYNSECGIAEYASKLYPLIEASFQQVVFLANKDVDKLKEADARNVLRTWVYGESDFKDTLREIKENAPAIVHVQYNGDFYSLRSLALLIDALKKTDSRCFLTLHSVAAKLDELNRIKGKFAGFAAIYVHSESDLQLLRGLGYQNATLFHHGVDSFCDEDRLKLREKYGLNGEPVIASHGLVHDRKGLLQLLKALGLLKKDYQNILLLAVNAVNTNNSTSSKIYEEMLLLAKTLRLEKNVIFIPEFLHINEITKLLHLSDLIVLPYDNIPEGASGAVRTSMGAMRPVVVTKSQIFAELEAGYTIRDNNPKTIAGGVRELLQNNTLYTKELEKIRTYSVKYSWERVSRDYLSALSDSG